MDTCNNIGQKQEILIQTLKQHGASLVGFGDISISGIELTRKFPVGISLGVKYQEK